jgi:hypothetical protein
MSTPTLKHLSNFSVKLCCCVWAISSLTTLADDSAVAKMNAVDTIRKTDGLVAFWDFQEEAGQDRVSADLRLQERGGKIQRVDEGVWGPHAARLNRGQWFEIPREKLGRLNIHGPAAEVTVVAWIKRETTQPWQAIAGVWGETRKKRQYCLFLNAPTATRFDTMQRPPVANRVHGHVSSVGGPTPGYEFCRTYSSGATDIPLHQWHCIAMRYDGHSSTVFVDGRLDTWTLRNPFPYDEGLFDGGTDGESFTVGAVHRNNEWGNFYGGLIGGLAVFDRALSDAELQVVADLAKD